MVRSGDSFDNLAMIFGDLRAYLHHPPLYILKSNFHFYKRQMKWDQKFLSHRAMGCRNLYAIISHTRQRRDSAKYSFGLILYIGCVATWFWIQNVGWVGGSLIKRNKRCQLTLCSSIERYVYWVTGLEHLCSNTMVEIKREGLRLPSNRSELLEAGVVGSVHWPAMYYCKQANKRKTTKQQTKNKQANTCIGCWWPSRNPVLITKLSAAGANWTCLGNQFQYFAWKNALLHWISFRLTPSSPSGLSKVSQKKSSSMAQSLTYIGSSRSFFLAILHPVLAGQSIFEPNSNSEHLFSFESQE